MDNQSKSDAKLSPIKRFVLEKRRFSPGSTTKYRLVKSLGRTGNAHLVDKTLLCPDVRGKHSEKLNERFQRKWLNVRKRELRYFEKINPVDRKQLGIKKPTDGEIAERCFRFLTIVDSVVVLDENEALRAASELRRHIEQCMGAVSNVACLGALEIEVISSEMMRRIRDLKSTNRDLSFDTGDIDPARLNALEKATVEDECRKLEVCEKLGEYLDRSVYAGDSGQLLVHFHGVVTAPDQETFDKLRDVLSSTPRWSLAPRQIELKRLSSKYAGKQKSTKKNLEDIARYLTKGGNDWNGGKNYLRYKLAFQNSMPLSEDEWLTKNIRTSKLIREVIHEDGIDDPLSLNANEVTVLTRSIWGMMNWNHAKTGYLVTVGRW